jgi:tRNA pseudouridine55 synthase
LAQFLVSTEKTYEATIRLGVATDTYDFTGRVATPPAKAPGSGEPEAIVMPDRATVENALATLVGRYPQAPPPFSAKKVDGVRSYARARRGEMVQPKPVEVTAHELTLESFHLAVIRLRVTCSAGFYVRALAHALGERLGIGAHLETLRRTASGGFDIRQAVALDVIEHEGEGALRRLLPMSDALPHLPSARLTEAGVIRAVHGRVLTPSDLEGPTAPIGPGPVRLLGPDGRLMALASTGPAPGSLHPFLVMG